jgi:hypothetical protein
LQGGKGVFPQAVSDYLLTQNVLYARRRSCLSQDMVEEIDGFGRSTLFRFFEGSTKMFLTWAAKRDIIEARNVAHNTFWHCLPLETMHLDFPTALWQSGRYSKE